MKKLITLSLVSLLASTAWAEEVICTMSGSAESTFDPRARQARSFTAGKDSASSEA